MGLNPAHHISTIAKLQAARHFHAHIRHDRAQDAVWAKRKLQELARAERSAARLEKSVQTAETRISGCKHNPTPLAVRQMLRIVNDLTKPGHVRVKAAARILEWSR